MSLRRFNPFEGKGLCKPQPKPKRAKKDVEVFVQPNIVTAIYGLKAPDGSLTFNQWLEQWRVPKAGEQPRKLTTFVKDEKGLSAAVHLYVFTREQTEDVADDPKVRIHQVARGLTVDSSFVIPPNSWFAQKKPVESLPVIETIQKIEPPAIEEPKPVVNIEPMKPESIPDKPKNGYKAFYKGRSIEVWAETSLKAQQLAAEQMNVKKSYEVTVVLCEKASGEAPQSMPTPIKETPVKPIMKQETPIPEQPKPAPEPEKPKPAKEPCNAHHIQVGAELYGDTGFISAVARVGGDIHHLGFGEFEARFPDGKIEFIRRDSYPIPNKSGRAHLIRGPEQLIHRILSEIEAKGLSISGNEPEPEPVREPEPKPVVAPTPVPVAKAIPAPPKPAAANPLASLPYWKQRAFRYLRI